MTGLSHLLHMNDNQVSEPFNIWEETDSPENYRLILDALPVPLICLSADQRIILTNHRVTELPVENGPIRVGRMACEYLPDQITGRMTVAIRTRTFLTIRNCLLWGTYYHLDCVPYTGSALEPSGMIVFRKAA